MKQVLTIAGSDSGGGAGIQADLKAMAANGVYGMSVITSITAQNTKGVTAVHDLPIPVIKAQLDAIFDDFDVAAVKTGMLSSVRIVEAVSRKLQQYKVANLVVDPVMISKSGQVLLQPVGARRRGSPLLLDRIQASRQDGKVNQLELVESRS